MDNFTLNTLNVTISQVSIGGKKLTKAIFNQIEFANFMTSEMDFAGESIIGYVKDKEQRYLLWVANGKLRKSGLKKYAELKSKIEWASLEKTEWFLIKTKLKHTMSDDYRDSLTEGLEEHDKYILLVNKAKEFLNSLNDKQIYF